MDRFLNAKNTELNLYLILFSFSILNSRSLWMKKMNFKYIWKVLCQLKYEPGLQLNSHQSRTYRQNHFLLSLGLCPSDGSDTVDPACTPPNSFFSLRNSAAFDLGGLDLAFVFWGVFGLLLLPFTFQHLWTWWNPVFLCFFYLKGP